MAELAKQNKDFTKEISQLRLRVIAIKGNSVEGLTPPEEEKNFTKVMRTPKEKELSQ